MIAHPALCSVPGTGAYGLAQPIEPHWQDSWWEAGEGSHPQQCTSYSYLLVLVPEWDFWGKA